MPSSGGFFLGVFLVYNAYSLVQGSISSNLKKLNTSRKQVVQTNQGAGIKWSMLKVQGENLKVSDYSPRTLNRVSFGPIGIKGAVEFNNIYKDNQEIPKDKVAAGNKNWKSVGKDVDLNINWYNSPEDPYVQLAFDGMGVLAAARLVIPKESENDFYKESKYFKEETISQKPYYTATVVFTDEGLLRGIGRQTTEDDEIVAIIEVKLKDGTYERIQRDACKNAQPNVFVEHGCRERYGLVFSPLKKEVNSCDYPFFLVYNEESTGELLGFGWLAPAKDIKKSKALSNNDIKKLFRSAPECIKGMTAVNIWLAKTDSQNSKCQVDNGKFVDTRCQPKMRGGEDF